MCRMAMDGDGPAAAGRSGRLHRGRAGAHQLEEFRRERAGAAGPADRKRRDEALRRRLSRLLHQARRQPVHQFGDHGPLGRFPARRGGAFRRDRRFAAAATGRRGCFGKSSGGYGAIAHALLYPDFWAGAACHSGDMGFELCYLPRIPAAAARARQEGRRHRASGSTTSMPRQEDRNDDIHDLMTLAHVRDLRPRPEAALRHPPAGDHGHLRVDRRALEELHGLGSGGDGGDAGPKG